MGDFWEEKLQFRTVRITLIKIIDGQKPIAELRFEGSGFHALPDLTSEDYRTFRLPAERSAARSEETSVFSFGFSESNIDMFAVRVDHINPHANEVRLTICNFRAVDLAKSF
jgi:hypothetical protein